MNRFAVYALAILLPVMVFGLLSMNWFQLYVVQTPSMGHSAMPGSLVVNVKQDDYEVGDIITFKVRNKFLLTE